MSNSGGNQLTREEVLAQAEEIRLIPEITPAQRAAYAIHLLPYMDDFETTSTKWRTANEKRFATLAELVDTKMNSVERVARIVRNNPAALTKLQSGEWDITSAARQSGVKVGRAGIAQSQTNGNSTITKYNMPDQWDAALHEAYVYLTHRRKKHDMQFPHVNPKEARQRVKDIDMLIELLTEARADLEPRSVPAATTAAHTRR